MMDNDQNTQENEAQNTQENEAQTTQTTEAAQPTEAAQDTKPTVNLADEMAKHNKQYETSAIVDQKGITKDIVLNEGTQYEYMLTLQFPGVATASQIEDDATGENGQIRFTDLMQAVIDNDVIVRPHIKSLDFWNTHKGYGQVGAEVLRFLNKGINGDLK
jgi:G:T/U-mismatch repair DNA glycosylase